MDKRVVRKPLEDKLDEVLLTIQFTEIDGELVHLQVGNVPEDMTDSDVRDELKASEIGIISAWANNHYFLNMGSNKPGSRIRLYLDKY